MALAFPDVYDVGMGHLGLKILYHIVNQRQDALAERVFAPWTDMEEQLIRRDLPPFQPGIPSPSEGFSSHRVYSPV